MKRVAAAVVVLALLVRSRVTLSGAGDANVGTYYAVAFAWLHGALPYMSVWEYKPPGLFALCAVGLLLFGDAERAANWLGTAAVVTTGIALFAIGKRLARPDERIVPAVAALSSVCLSVENRGLPGDAEIFVNAFAALAFLGASASGALRAACFAGIAAALALQMKLTALPIVAAVLLALVARFRHDVLRTAVVFSALTVAPFAVEGALYANAGIFAAFADANWYATLRRARALRAHGDPRTWLAQVRLLAPSLEAALAACIRPSPAAATGALWLAAAVIAVAAPGEWYERQFPLLVPPVALLGAVGLARLVAPGTERTRTALAALFVLATFALHGYYETRRGIAIAFERTLGGRPDYENGEYARELTALRSATGGDRSFYAIQMSPEIYADLGVAPPTRYVFAGNLLEPAMWPMLGLRGRDELARVLATRPDFLAVGPLDGELDPGAIALIERTVAREYVAACDVVSIRVYELRARYERSPARCDASRSST